MLSSALGFGFGFILGGLLIYGIFSSNLLNLLLDLVATGRIFIGVLLALLVAALGGAVAGAIGGLPLCHAHSSTRWGDYAWRSALSVAAGFGLVALPLTLVVALLGFYELADVSPLALMIPFGLLGLLFGTISGLALGLLTVGRDAWRVVLTGAISFGLGGAGLGQWLFRYLLTRQDMAGSAWYLFGGLFVFGLMGGGGWGFLYSWLAHRRPEPALPSRFVRWFKRQGTLRRVLAVVGLIILFIVIRALWVISPFTSFAAPLESTLESRTIDTRWANPLPLATNAARPTLAADNTGHVALAWIDNSDVFWLTGDNQPVPVNVSNSAAPSTDPQIAVDAAGVSHLVWVETGNMAADIFYSRCQDSACTPPAKISGGPSPACLPKDSAQNSQPALVVNESGLLLVVWRNGERSLPYVTWTGGQTPPAAPTGCVPPQNDTLPIDGPRLAAGPDGGISLVFSQSEGEQPGGIYLAQFSAGNWTVASQIGTGLYPEIAADAAGQFFAAWCGANQQLNTWHTGSATELMAGPRCVDRPGLAIDGNGALRLVWYAAEAQNVRGVTNTNSLLYDSFQTDTGWSEPAIIGQTAAETRPALTAANDGTLYLAWAESGDSPSTLFYTTHMPYTCDESQLTPVGQVVYETVRQEKFRPAGDTIPYCHNQFDQLLYAPNPPPYTGIPPTTNGVFDEFAELAKTAQYEVVFATMWYDSLKEVTSPGRVLGQAISDLYHQVKANPERYPRGMTVRILLGNPPKFAFFPTFNNQVWTAVGDLVAGGLPELQNDEIGWKVEVGNFSGSWPHSHTKMMVVDGKTAQTVGYNMQYSHLPTDHPSGKGKGRFDMGIQVTGPAAQASLRAFDDLWQASTRVHCDTLDPNQSFWWMLSCSAEPATTDHVPEVLRYSPTDGDSNAFAVFRTNQFKESDEAYYNALAAAQNSLDVIHINFSLDTICALNILVEACNYANRIDYMDALMNAIEKNNIQTRILVSDIAWVGIENNIAIDAFEKELAARGLSDNVEIRYFEQDMHLKSALIDDELLFVGSQNFHYSAWGGAGSLAEYNLASDDPEAIRQYKEFFDYYWGRATKREAE
jgi:hypothetical protein